MKTVIVILAVVGVVVFTFSVLACIKVGSDADDKLEELRDKEHGKEET